MKYSISSIGFIHYQQKYETSVKHIGNTCIWHFDLMKMSGHQPQTRVTTLIQPPYVVLWTKNAIRKCSKLKINQYNLQKCVIFTISPKIPHSFLGIHHCIVNLWEFCLCSIIRYWQHAKFATGCPIIIWALKQNDRDVWLVLLYLVMWYPIENLLHLCKSCLLKVRGIWS